MDTYDVIIIGSGAGGGTLARHLAPSGKRILLLERGGLAAARAAELAGPGRVRREPLRLTGDLVRRQRQAVPASGPLRRGPRDQVLRAALYRLRAEDFRELRHHDGASPAWPLSYDGLEPYHSQAEQMYEVQGACGEDPTEPPASAPYPFPAVSHEPRIQQVSDDLEAEGYHPFHAPCGIRLDESNMPHSACVRCINCDGFPCAVHGKSDAEVLGVRPALEHPNVTLLTDAEAIKLETNPTARWSPR
jgi:choline dehydrogenase-like flavoprotein